ncbi:MAG TPA: glycosyltransferase, partial [Usitatibacter sp.]|nr:glycosyltransferase [Usitatibacter sp.]
MSSISLCVPMFRSAAFLPDLVRRLSGLDPRPDEIVFLDDASPDDSGKLLRELADAASPRLDCRLIAHETNAGIAASYNRLVHEAASEWVHILDAD